MSLINITEEEKDRLLVQRQRTIDALLDFVGKLLKEREGAENEHVLKIETLRQHVANGGEIATYDIDAAKADRAMKLMEFFKVDHFATNHNAGEEGSDYITVLTRDDQSEEVSKVMDAIRFDENAHLLWLGIEDYLRYSVGHTVERITIPSEQIAELTTALDNTDLIFSVNFLTEDKADVYFMPGDRTQMIDAVNTVRERHGIYRDPKIRDIEIDSAYTAEKLARDTDRPTRSMELERDHELHEHRR